MKIKLKAFFEQAKKLPGPARDRVKKLLEDGYMDGDREMEVAEEPAAVEPDEALRSGFCASCNAIIDQALQGEIEPTAALAKLKELLTSHAKLAGADEKDTEEEEDDEEDKPVKEGEEDDAEKDKEKMEQRRRLQRLERKDRVRTLCEVADVSLAGEDGQVLLEMLVGLPDDKAVEKAIAREKGRGGKPAGKPPRSGATGGSGNGKGKEVQEQKTLAELDPDQQLAWLRR